MFTVSAVVTNVCALPVGTILDAQGPRLTASIGGILIALGSLLFAFASTFPYDGYLFGYLLLAMGGSFVFISSFHLSNTFPKHSGLILSLLTGSFDSSSALFLLFRVLHGPNLTLRNMFLIYLIVPGFILASQVFLMPSTSYSTVGELLRHAEEILSEDINDPFREESRPSSRYHNLATKIDQLLENEEILGGGNDPHSSASRSNSLPTQAAIESRKPAERLVGVMHTFSPMQQIRSLWFILITIFAVIQMLRLNFFISTIRLQYEYLLDSHSQAERLNHIFDFFLPLGGLVAIPIIGLILDRASIPMTLLVLVCSATIIGTLGCIPHSLGTAYANITLFVVFRPYFYTLISDYTAKIFGFQTFGKVYGLAVCLAGLGNFIQSPLDILTYKKFDRNPIPVNVILTVTAFIAGSALVSFVYWKSVASGSHDVETAPGPHSDYYDDDHNEETDRLLRSSAERAESNTHYGAAGRDS